MGKQLYKAWLATVRKQGSRVAVREPDGGQVSFSELQQGIEQRIAASPEMQGWRNRIVALQFRNSRNWLEAFLVCQAVEAIALPFETDVPRDGLMDILGHLRPVALWNNYGIEALENASLRHPACLIKLTSGSTGLPRPLFFGDEHMIADGRQVMSTMGIRPTDTNLAVIPFGHSYGLGNLVMPLILQGTAIAVCREPFPHSIAEAICSARATVVPTVPAILNGLARAGLSRSQVASVRLWISAGSPLSPADAALFHDVFGIRIHNFYGSSETGGIAYDRTGQETLSGRSVGAPMKGVEASVTGSGRLRVTSKAVFQRGNPHRCNRQGAHLLADLARISDTGNIVLLGRRSRMVKIAGRRVNLSEVEYQLLQIPGIESARVVDYRTQTGRTRLAAAIAPIQPSARIREALKSHLPTWKVPDKWIALSAFPLTSRGKVNFRDLDTRLRTGGCRQGKP